MIILGGGPNRIGQGIEFDYCCCHASFALQEMGFETVMINCNPETVSTDYDTSDRLYFEPLTLEDVLHIYQREAAGASQVKALVQYGGQTPLNLAAGLQAAGVPILGTQPEAIELAEDRESFSALLAELDIPAPANGIAHSTEQALSIAARIGYPLVVRPFIRAGRAGDGDRGRRGESAPLHGLRRRCGYGDDDQRPGGGDPGGRVPRRRL